MIFFKKSFDVNQNYITVGGTSWWRWQVKKLSDGGVFFDKHFAYFFANEKVRKNHELIQTNGFHSAFAKHDFQILFF